MNEPALKQKDLSPEILDYQLRMSEEKRRYDYQLRMSEEIGELAKALAAAQAEFQDVVKDKKGYNYKYSDLASVLQACRPQLAKQGIAIVQRPLPTDGTKARIETMLIHTSGQWISGELHIVPAKADPQGIGSVITYARRYSIQGMVGLASEDDDAASVSQPQGGKQRKIDPPKPSKKTPATDDEIGRWTEFFENAETLEDLEKTKAEFVKFVKTHDVSDEQMNRAQAIYKQCESVHEEAA